ncbi:MAG: UDP-N-acetylmuramoyl-L-alanine--D-glutamate ligase [Pseudomonadota bacterium]
MIAVTPFAGKRAAVFGLGGSGLATARALAAGGADVVCADDNAEKLASAADAGLATLDLHDADFSTFDALVLAPGVPLTHPKPHWTVTRAKDAGIEIIGDIELFDRERRARLPGIKLVAITGTNGKSTTTALLGHILGAMGVDCQVGGNIGKPALDLDPRDGVVVLEVSSFQIDLAPGLRPDVGVLLNVSTDHIDRHGSFEAYAAIKTSLLDHSAAVVLGHEDETANLYARRFTRVISPKPSAHQRRPVYGFCADPFQPNEGHPRRPSYSTKDVFWDADYKGAVAIASDVERQRFDKPPHVRDVPIGWGIYVERSGVGERMGTLPDAPALRGIHNIKNAAAALACLLPLDLDPADALAHLESFPGLPHRMEEVGRDGALTFVNDSKATNVGSAETALRALKNVYWIAGGRPKPGGLSGFEPARYDIRSAYLIGEAEADFSAALSPSLPAYRCGTLDKAFSAALADARAAGSGTVLLSPACASFDQFRSFEERGDAFRDLVHAKLGLAHG